MFKRLRTLSRADKNVLYFALIVLCLLVAAYANHFENGFHFDDYHTIVNNAFIRSPKNIPAFFTDPKMFSADPSHWGLRSLVTATLALDYWLGGGLDPFYFQLSTFIWHIALSVLLFFVYRCILRQALTNITWVSYLALAAASIFALHTANAETINYVISRSDVLSTAMIVLSLGIYMFWPAKRKYYLYVIPAFIGVFAKETVPVLLILLFFYILIFEKKLPASGLFKAANFKIVIHIMGEMLPLILVVIVTQLYTLSRISSIPGISNPLLPYVLTQSFVWVHYFIAFFLPVNLSADSDWKVLSNLLDERVIIGILFVIALVIAIFKTSAKKDTRPVAFGLIWFAAALLPTSLAPFAEVTNDHRMYFPFIGLALSAVSYAGLLLMRYEQKFKTRPRFLYMAAALLAVLCLHAYGIYQRDKVWKNDETLWHDVVMKSPENGRGMMNYGLSQMAVGNYTVAEFYYKRASQLIPYYSPLYINMGVLYGAMHNDGLAEQNFKTAMIYGRGDFDPYFYYGRYLNENNRVQEARAMAEKAYRMNPYSVSTIDLLLNIYNQLELWQPMQQLAQQLAKIAPGDQTAVAYSQASKTHTPVVISNNKALKETPVTAADYLNQSLDLYNKGNYELCISACNKALRLKPDYADAYSNIGAAYNKLKQWDKSIDACKKALAIDPKHALAAGNLKFAESQQAKARQ